MGLFNFKYYSTEAFLERRMQLISDYQFFERLIFMMKNPEFLIYDFPAFEL